MTHGAAYLRGAAPFLIPVFCGGLMGIIRLRALPVREQAQTVDRENRIISGVSAAQAVEALGHDVILDATTIQQIVDLGNANPKGVKCRFTHPGLSSDGLGKFLGRLKNWRVDGDKAVADLHLSKLASVSPDGDLGEYVMGLAEEDPGAFGMSVVVEANRAWVMADGRELIADDDIPPKGAMTEMPVLRVVALPACDVVDEPAANRDGMFSAYLWGSNVDAEQAFAAIDRYISDAGISPAKAFEFAMKYFDARGVSLKGKAMSNENATHEQNAGGGADTSVIDALQAELAEKEKALAEQQRKFEELSASLTASNERIAKMEEAARQARLRALCADWAGETEKHLTVLGALEEGSEAFQAYVAMQTAVSAQLSASQLFGETGHDASGSTSALAEIEAKARKLRSETGMSEAEAFAAVVEQHPELYAAHRKES